MTTPTFQAGGQPAPGTRPLRPSRRAVLVEHVRTIGFALRIPILVAVPLGVLLTVFIGFQIAIGHVSANLHAGPPVWPGFIGALLPIAVWAREERFGPGFLWTLPVDRREHALTRVLAGWVWLMGGVTVFTLAQLVLVVVSGGQVLPVETLNVLTSPVFTRESLDPATLSTVRWAPGPLIWAVPFAAATATYLLASALMLGTRHVIRWVIAAVLAFPVTTIVSNVVSRAPGMSWMNDAPDRALSLLLGSRYGLDALMTVRTMSLDRRATLASGERIHVWRAVPEISAWGVAALLWIGVGLLALWFAASRHRERRRP